MMTFEDVRKEIEARLVIRLQWKLDSEGLILEDEDCPTIPFEALGEALKNVIPAKQNEKPTGLQEVKMSFDRLRARILSGCLEILKVNADFNGDEKRAMETFVNYLNHSYETVFKVPDFWVPKGCIK